MSVTGCTERDEHSIVVALKEFPVVDAPGIQQCRLLYVWWDLQNARRDGRWRHRRNTVIPAGFDGRFQHAWISIDGDRVNIV
jgi:hypothetical protein